MSFYFLVEMMGVPHLPLLSSKHFASRRVTLRRALPLLEAALARFKFFLPPAEKPFFFNPTKPKNNHLLREKLFFGGDDGS